ncbi:MAG: hypothetical protein D6739_00900, partial [Nitrospirae bacterium]
GWGRLILCGGGSLNPVLAQEIGRLVAPLPVAASGAFGVEPEAVEAVGFALLGLDCVAGTAAAVGPITGGPGHPILGEIQPGPGYRALARRLLARTPTAGR